jgi:hypothetical protein
VTYGWQPPRSRAVTRVISSASGPLAPMRLANEALHVKDFLLALPGPIVAAALMRPSLFPRSPAWYLLPPFLFFCLLQLVLTAAAIARDSVAYAPLARGHLLWLVSSGLPLIGAALKLLV